MYYFKHERVVIVEIYAYGVDESTTTGYCVITLFHILVLILATAGMGATDIFYTALIINVPIMGRLIEDDIRVLNQVLIETPNKTSEWKSRFRNILLMHREQGL